MRDPDQKWLDDYIENAEKDPLSNYNDPKQTFI